MQNTQAKTDSNPILQLIAQGQLAQALSAVEAMLSANASDAKAWHMKGMICARMGNYGASIPCLVQAVQHQPDFKEACLDLGHTLTATNQPAVAIKAYQHLLQIDLIGEAPKPTPPLPANVKAAEEWRRKGELAQQQGDYAQAAHAFRQVLLLLPHLPEALTSLGIALWSQGNLVEAEQCLLHCLRVRGDYGIAFNVLGAVYKDMGQNLRAIAVWSHGRISSPANTDLLTNLAKELAIIEQYNDAIAMCEELLLQIPDHLDILMMLLHMLYMLCRFDRASEISARIEKIFPSASGNTEPFIMLAHYPQHHAENVKRYTQKHYPKRIPHNPAMPLPSLARKDGKLRIGYLSCDFHNHATAHLISELFERHDRSRFGIYAYSYGIDTNDAAQTRIANAVDAFRRISTLGDTAISELIRQDGIDILVDLKGYTTGSRLGMLAARSAPVQMHYLGFPGTLASEFVDYFITDSIASPLQSSAEFTEKLIRLPHSYQMNDRSRPLPKPAATRASYGLPEKGFVFCGFNRPYKITHDIFSAWMRLLKATPESVLWLYETHPEVSQNLRSFAQKQGIDPSRIIMAGRAPLAEHLARYAHVDLFLDTAPVCGHTTSSDALWCGVPVITLSGNTFISRVAASLLHAVGLPELVMADISDYEAEALALAREPARLAKLRQQLADTRLTCKLFDSLATTRALEAAYEHAAAQHAAAHAPSSFSLTSELKVIPQA